LLTAVGDINTYALFAELCRHLLRQTGRLGVIVPTNIATDDTTKDFFSDVVRTGSLARLTGFENEAFIFPAVHHAFKFCLFVVAGKAIRLTSASFLFFCRHFGDLAQPERQFTLSVDDFQLLNPNTNTCPVFRTKADSELTKKLCRSLPILVNEATSENPWGVDFLRMFDMANDSGLFDTKFGHGNVPLYEPKLIHQYDHRYATFEGATAEEIRKGLAGKVLETRKQDPNMRCQPRYWVDQGEVDKRLGNRSKHRWLLGVRGVTSPTNERTLIASIIPYSAAQHNLWLLYIDVDQRYVAPFLANLNALPFDYIVRQKINTYLSQFVIKQLPILAPNAYRKGDVEYISDR
jgi:hypothetical protein